PTAAGQRSYSGCWTSEDPAISGRLAAISARAAARHGSSSSSFPSAGGRWALSTIRGSRRRSSLPAASSLVRSASASHSDEGRDSDWPPVGLSDEGRKSDRTVSQPFRSERERVGTNLHLDQLALGALAAF